MLKHNNTSLKAVRTNDNDKDKDRSKMKRLGCRARPTMIPRWAFSSSSSSIDSDDDEDDKSFKFRGALWMGPCTKKPPVVYSSSESSSSSSSDGDEEQPVEDVHKRLATSHIDDTEEEKRPKKRVKYVSFLILCAISHTQVRPNRTISQYTNLFATGTGRRRRRR
jgi:hypothetical protein